MTDKQNSESGAYQRARETTEQALDAFVDGNQKAGEKLVDEAKSMNKDAVRDVQQELEDDAKSEHDIEKLNDKMASGGKAS